MGKPELWIFCLAALQMVVLNLWDCKPWWKIQRNQVINAFIDKKVHFEPTTESPPPLRHVKRKKTTAVPKCRSEISRHELRVSEINLPTNKKHMGATSAKEGYCSNDESFKFGRWHREHGQRSNNNWTSYFLLSAVKALTLTLSYMTMMNTPRCMEELRE